MHPQPLVSGLDACPRYAAVVCVWLISFPRVMAFRSKLRFQAQKVSGRENHPRRRFSWTSTRHTTCKLTLGGAGSSQSTPRSGNPGVPFEAASFGHSEGPLVDATFSDRHREALAGVSAAEGGGAVPQQGRLSRRYQERECSGDERELASADGLGTLQAYLLARESREPFQREAITGSITCCSGPTGRAVAQRPSCHG